MRRHLIVLGLAALLLLGGCTQRSSFADGVSYDDRWDSDATAAFYVEDDLEIAVIAVTNETNIELSRESGIGGDEPIRVDSVRFRHPNGTVTNVSTVETTASETVVTLPARRGELAYAVRRSPGRFVHPMPVDGSARVALPPGSDARNPALGDVAPGDYEIVSEDPFVVRWDELERGATLSVRYYDREDPILLIGLLAGLLAAAIGVLLYYRRVFDRLRTRTSRLED